MPVGGATQLLLPKPSPTRTLVSQLCFTDFLLSTWFLRKSIDGTLRDRPTEAGDQSPILHQQGAGALKLCAALQ